MRPYRRRHYFIDHDFQLKYILLVIFMLLLYTMTFIGILFIPQLLPFLFKSSLEDQVKAADILLLYHTHVWPAVFIVIPMFGFFSIFITHKIAGPAYRLKKKLTEMAAWNLNSTLTLRKGDDLHELAECANILSDELKTLVADIHDSFDTILGQIAAIEKQIAEKTIDEINGRAMLLRLETCKESLEKSLSRFRTDSDPDPK